jgi:hypothetical protein
MVRAHEKPQVLFGRVPGQEEEAMTEFLQTTPATKVTFYSDGTVEFTDPDGTVSTETLPTILGTGLSFLNDIFKEPQPDPCFCGSEHEPWETEFGKGRE